MSLGNIASVEEMPQQWRVVGNAVCGLNGPRLESDFRSRDKRAAAQPTSNPAS